MELRYKDGSTTKDKNEGIENALEHHCECGIYCSSSEVRKTKMKEKGKALNYHGEC